MTDDPRYYYQVAEEFKKRGAEFESLSLEDDIPPHVKVVVTSPPEVDRVSFPWLISEEEGSLAAERALATVKFGFLIKGEMIIGVDPGKRPGVAVLSRNRVLFAKELSSPEEITEVLGDILKIYPGKSILKCGRGGGIYRDRTLKAVQDNFEIPIYLVDEAGTTPMVTEGMSHNVMAAVNIAFKRGRRLRRKVVLEPKKGETRSVQKYSRKVSGDVTLSEELAEKVAKGEMGLDEAIGLQRSGG